jgi:hypothetical protein
VNLYQLSLTQERQDSGWQFRYFQSQKKEVSYSVISLNYDKVIENGRQYLGEMFAKRGVVKDIAIAKLHGSIDSQIIAPTWNKNLSPQISASWKTAYNSLRKANELRIMGYSLPSRVLKNH